MKTIAAGVSLLTALVLVTVPGCGMLSLIGKSKSRHDSLVVAIPASGKFSVRNFNGRIQCVAGDVDEIQVEADLHARGATDEAAQANLDLVEIVTTETDDATELVVVFPAGVSGGASLTITLPGELALDLTTSNGEISADGVVGGIVAKTSNGAIKIERATGEISATTSNGGISVGGRDLQKLQVKTSNGAVGLSGSLAPGDHSVRTSNGAIAAVMVGGVIDVTATTSNGKIINGATKVKSGETFRLGEKTDDEGDAVATKLTLRTSNGSVRASFEPLSPEEVLPPDETIQL